MMLAEVGDVNVVSLGRLEGLDGSCGHCWVMMKVGISMR
jgi:hypothetical protein